MAGKRLRYNPSLSGGSAQIVLHQPHDAHPDVSGPFAVVFFQHAPEIVVGVSADGAIVKKENKLKRSKLNRNDLKLIPPENRIKNSPMQGETKARNETEAPSGLRFLRYTACKISHLTEARHRSNAPSLFYFSPPFSSLCTPILSFIIPLPPLFLSKLYIYPPKYSKPLP